MGLEEQHAALVRPGVERTSPIRSRAGNKSSNGVLNRLVLSDVALNEPGETASAARRVTSVIGGETVK